MFCQRESVEFARYIDSEVGCLILSRNIQPLVIYGNVVTVSRVFDICLCLSFASCFWTKPLLRLLWKATLHKITVFVCNVSARRSLMHYESRSVWGHAPSSVPWIISPVGVFSKPVIRKVVDIFWDIYYSHTVAWFFKAPELSIFNIFAGDCIQTCTELVGSYEITLFVLQLSYILNLYGSRNQVGLAKIFAVILPTSHFPCGWIKGFL